jgi:mRNA interferase HigB
MVTARLTLGRTSRTAMVVVADDDRPAIRDAVDPLVAGAGTPVAPKMGSTYTHVHVRVIARRTLREFWEAGHADAEQPLEAWFAEVHGATWKSMAEIKRRYPRASVIDAERVVFNIGGNKYRLLAKVWFPGQAMWIKFIGTHEQYDRIHVKEL